LIKKEKRKIVNNLLNLKKRKCPVCDSKNYSIFYKNDNYSKIDTRGIIYRYKHILVICNNCNLVYSNPWLGYKNTNKIYSNSAIGAAFEDSNKAKKHFKCFKSFFQKKNSFDKNTKILEIGTATGILLKNISNFYNLKKKNLDGIEPSKKLYEKLKNNNYFKIENKFIDQMKGKNKYDLIIMDNVLEHIEEPKKALDKIKSLMNTSSKLYIAIPNIFKYKNNFRDPFGHTINYYENNIKYLFENNGFKILKLKKHYNYLNFIAKIEATNKKIKYQFKKDSKNKFDRVRNFIKKAVKYKVSIKKKFLLLEKNIKKNNQKIILFGSSNFALEFLNSTNLKKNIKFIVDSNPIYHNKKKFNLNVMSPQKIKNEKFDKILITSRAFSKDIYKTLIKLGVAKNKIIKL
jgi:2-polyprenyl-3-methyl-5-hydroxy-6-metoxy-1,4-benzoquinol methylase